MRKAVDQPRQAPTSMPARPANSARIAEQNRGFIAVDEADGRVAPVDPEGMVDLLAEEGPGRDALVGHDHVRKQVVENRRLEGRRDVVLGHQ